MKFMTQFSIRTTTLLIGTILLLSNVLLVFIYIIPLSEHEARRHAMQEFSLRLTSLQGSVDTLIRKHDEEELARLVADQSAFPEHRTLCIVDDKHRILASNRMEWKNKDIRKLNFSFSEKLSNDAVAYRKTITNMDSSLELGLGYSPISMDDSQIILGEHRIGYIFMEYDLRYEIFEHRSYHLRQIVFSSTMSAFMLLIFWIVIQYVVTIRARNLIDVSRKFASGNQNARVVIDGNDEISQIGKSFNALADRVVISQESLSKNEERLNIAIDGANDGFWDLNMKTGEVYLSPRWENMLGYPEGTLKHHMKTWIKLTHPEDRTIVKDAVRNYIFQRKELFIIEYRIRTSSGVYKWVMLRGKIAERDSDGEPLRAAGTQTDISERKSFEEKLERQALALDQMPEAIMIFDLHGLVVDMNTGAEELFLVPRERVIGKNLNELKFTDGILFEDILKSLQLDSRWEKELEIKIDHETIKIIDAVSVPFINSENTLMAVITVIRDVTDKRGFERKLQYLATHDILTDLPNRTLITDRLTTALRRAKRSDTSVAVIFMDLDGFKDVNDTHGHAVGDELLKQVASRLLTCVRESDSIGRFGGDEFLIVLDGVDGKEQVCRIADRVLQMVGMPFYFSSEKVLIHTSMGICMYNGQGDSPDDMIRKADNAMYNVKKHGKNNYEFISGHL